MKFFNAGNKKRILCISFAFICIIITAILLFTHLRTEKDHVSDTRFMLDTICTITLYDTPDNGNDIIDGAFAICDRYEKLLSQTVSGSDIYRINHSHGKPVVVSAETAGLLMRSVEYCRKSEGAFDITIAPVKALWDFSGDNSSLPDARSLAMAVSSVDYTLIKIDGQTVTLPDGMGIDLGAIAKGFITDRIAEYLRAEKVSSAIIDLGGNIYVIGSKPDGNLWRIGIRKPFADTEADVVEAADCSVVTSGIYQRFFENDGVIYHHILCSSDGMPCQTGLFSVTVISESSEQCDALSTICMLMGQERAKLLLSDYPDIQAVFITSDQEIVHYGI